MQSMGVEPERQAAMAEIGVGFSPEGLPVASNDEQANQLVTLLQSGESFIDPEGRKRTMPPMGAAPPEPAPQSHSGFSSMEEAAAASEAMMREQAQQEQAEPVVVSSPSDLRAKIQSGLIPLGGKYVVNGVTFTRTR
jgi:hypothetical protein